MTPYTLQMLLHFYYCSGHFNGGGSPAYVHGRSYLLSLKVIEKSDTEAIYKTTPLGDAWVRTILKTPTPQVAYVDERGKVIE